MEVLLKCELSSCCKGIGLRFSLEIHCLSHCIGSWVQITPPAYEFWAWIAVTTISPSVPLLRNRERSWIPISYKQIQTLLKALTIRSRTRAIKMGRPKSNIKSAPPSQISCDPQIVCFKPEASFSPAPPVVRALLTSLYVSETPILFILALRSGAHQGYSRGQRSQRCNQDRADRGHRISLHLDPDQELRKVGNPEGRFRRF